MTQATGYMVFWMEDTGSHMGVYVPACQHFEPHQMADALNCMKDLRQRSDVEFVGMVSQDPNSVGRPGVDAVVDGKTPDGHEYTWKKRRV